MPDQWDPKYPRTGGTWDAGYVLASQLILDPSLDWGKAFDAVVKADGEGEFEGVRGFYEYLGGSQDTTRVGDFRLALWDLYCKPIFTRKKTTDWPIFAQKVHGAVPKDWEKKTGRIRGIPEAWRKNDRKRLWAFKSTVLFIAGLVEGRLVPATNAKLHRVVRGKGPARDRIRRSGPVKGRRAP